jgi:integrase
MVRKEMHTLDSDGVQRLLHVFRDSNLYPIVHLAIFTGMRRSEILGLRWRDVDLDRSTIQVVQTLHQLRDKSFRIEQPKSAAGRRQVKLSPMCVDVLRAHRRARSTIDPDALVFTARTGRQYSPDTLSQRFSRIVRPAGFDIRFHDLRHTHASLLLAEGVPVRTVADRLGHSTAQITLDVYAHTLPGGDQAAANLLDRVLASAEVRTTDAVS